MGFFLNGEVLYKKGKDQILLRCVDVSEAKKIVHEIHEAIYGTHASGHVMARQIIRAEYYWMGKAFPERALILAKMNGKEFSSPINVDIVKKYYA